MKLSAHFDLAEFTASQTAARLGISNMPNAVELGEIQRTAEMLELTRRILGNRVITITSGFRGRQLNDAVPGSSKTSAHVWGGAADFICPGYGTPLEICRDLATYKESLNFDQLIYEFGSWVHIGRSRDGRSRRQLLVIDGSGTRDVTGEGFP